MSVAQVALQKGFVHRFRVPVNPVIHEPNRETIADEILEDEFWNSVAEPLNASEWKKLIELKL